MLFEACGFTTDNMVLFAESIEELQDLLDFHIYFIHNGSLK